MEAGARGEAGERLVPLSLRDMTYACRVLTPRRRTGGEPLVLIGGALQDMYSWPRLERRLTAHTTVVLMDLPGTGNAGDLAAGAGFEVLAEAARYAIDRLALGPVNVLGASYGAPIAYRLAQSYPDRVARLLLAGATPRVGPRLTAVVRQGLALVGTAGSRPAAEPERRAYARNVVDMLVNSATRQEVAQGPAVARLLERQLLRTSQSAALRYAACHERLLDTDLYPPGGISGVPALVFTGEHDCASSPAENAAVAATIDGCAFALIRDADHMAHLERDAEYADLVTRFLRDESVRGLPYCRYPGVRP
ncbi:alpha/beta fold hydrolase [Streptomyces sp. NRRL F-4489]|uniref:alpha/beta fold hydrolase n=1 Tax=Streptomyces sp. NRRL F-4489 TaxID=1609095 RepID=UPI0022772098|nr:alpha/beta hydrolase [Streptomyces sp. NRRL F-4489]